MKVTTVKSNGTLVKVSFETESVSENIIETIREFIHDKDVSSQNEVKTTKVVQTPTKRKKVAKKEAIEPTDTLKGIIENRPHTVAGNLTAKPISELEREVIEESFAQPYRDIKPITPQEAFAVDAILDSQDEENLEGALKDLKEAKELFEAKIPEPLKEIAKEKVTMVAPLPPKPEAPKPQPTADELQPKDVIEQMKKTNGEDYLNRRGKLIIQKQDVEEEQSDVPSFLEVQWNKLLERAAANNIKTSGLVFEAQTQESINELNSFIDKRLEAQANK